MKAYDQGMNIVFFGAAAVLRHSRLQASTLGPGQEEVNYRDSAEDPLDGNGDPMQVTGNTWSSPPSNWSEVPFVGQIYSGYTNPGVNAALPMTVTDASAWIYRGTGLQNGSLVPNVILSDIDHLGPVGTVPANLDVFAHSPVSTSVVFTSQGSWNGTRTPTSLTTPILPPGLEFWIPGP